MDLNGEAIRASRRWRAHVATGIIVAVAVMVLGLATGTLRRGGSTERLATAPGYTDANVPIDTSPFALAEASRKGPTTIPGNLGVASEPTVPPETVPPSTTAPPPTQPAPIIAAPADDKLCLGIQQIAEPYRLSASLKEQPRRLAELVSLHFGAASRLISEAGDPRLDSLVQTLDRLAFVAATAQTADEVAAILNDMSQFRASAGPELAPALDHAAATCPGFADPGGS